VGILAEKAGTLKSASVISKKSQTISLVWFRELACTVQKAAFNTDRGWGEGQKQHAGDSSNLQPALLVRFEEILPVKKFQKTISTIHRTTKIFSCTAQEKDALLRLKITSL